MISGLKLFKEKVFTGASSALDNNLCASSCLECYILLRLHCSIFRFMIVNCRIQITLFLPLNVIECFYILYCSTDMVKLLDIIGV